MAAILLYAVCTTAPARAFPIPLARGMGNVFFVAIINKPLLTCYTSNINFKVF